MISSLFSFRGDKVDTTLDIDLHSHLIPGIDDGAKDMQESLALLKALEDLGYKKVITTPHIMVDTYCNTKEIIDDGLNKLRVAAKKNNLSITIDAAAEYYLDDGFLAHLHGGKVLTFGDNYLLFETSYMAKPLSFDDTVDTIIALGYKPVLAHPERYRYIDDLKTEYQVLKDKGIYFQVNINSFGGHYAKDAKMKAEYLSKHGMIDFLGSDIHHIKQVSTLKKTMQKNTYKNIYKNNTILNQSL